MKRSMLAVLAAAGMLGLSTASAQETAASRSLTKCQNAIGKEVLKYGASYEKEVGKCLDQIAKLVVQKGEPIAGAAAKCAKSFLKLENSANPDKTIASRMAAKIANACDPGIVNAKAAHAETDIFDAGGQRLDGSILAPWCESFGGAGSASSDLDDLDEWVPCLTEVATCGAQQALVTKYPRLLEWLNGLKPEILALDGGCDASCNGCNEIANEDACNALTAIESAIDGATDDGLPEIACGPASGGPTGGGLLSTGQTQCDQGDYTLGACPGSPAGQDASVGAGRALSYTDNGDGTITDNATGLMWEKLSDDGSIHDKDTFYSWDNDALVPWDGAFTKIAALNGGGGFAGYTDWRLPNIRELESIVDRGRWPAIDPAFNTGCVAACTVTTCSCTFMDYYWSSTSFQDGPGNAWLVGVEDGDVNYAFKSNIYYVRAVRGGL